MDKLMVRCPESGRREEIEGYVGRDGELLVVLRCSRFDPTDAITCSGECAHGPAHAAAPANPWRLPLV